MINAEQLLDYIIDPVLTSLRLNSESARKLLLITAATESCLGTYIRQVPNGPALGIYQMEPKTYYDIWDNYLKYNPNLSQRLLNVTEYKQEPHSGCLMWDLRFASAMARFHYLRWPEKLPEASDVEGLIQYYFKYWGPNPLHTSLDTVSERVSSMLKGVV